MQFHGECNRVNLQFLPLFKRDLDFPNTSNTTVLHTLNFVSNLVCFTQRILSFQTVNLHAFKRSHSLPIILWSGVADSSMFRHQHHNATALSTL